MNAFKRDDGKFINYLFILIMTVLLWPVNCYSYILPSLFYGIVIRWGQYFAAGAAVLMVFYTKKSNTIFNLNLLLSVVLMLSTIVNNGNVNKCLNYVAPMLGTVSLIAYYFGFHKEKELLHAFKTVLLFYMIINLVTYFAFPNGLYTAELITWTIDRHNTFLGNRNSYKYYGLLLILAAYLENYSENQYEKKKNRGMILAISLAVLTEILGGSLTGAITIFIVALYYFLGHKLLRIRKFDPRIFFAAGIGIFVILIFFVTEGKLLNYLAFIFSGNVTFSNRVRIWIAAKNLIMANPILGIGTQSSEYLFSIVKNVHFHNQFLEIAVRGGLVSLAIYVLIIWSAFKQMYRYKNYSMTPFMCICIFLAIIINMVECETYSYAIITYFTAFAYCWDYPSEYRTESLMKTKRLVLKLRK